MSQTLAIVKDTLGLLGSCAATVPWFRDFLGRLRVVRIVDMSIGASLRRLHAELQHSVESWISKPKAGDFIFMVGGLLLIGLSFLIGLVQTWQGPA